MTVGEVVDSRAEGFAEGDTVWHASGWRTTRCVTAGEDALRGVGRCGALDVRETPPQAYLGVLGANGLTAYARPSPRWPASVRATRSGCRRRRARSGASSRNSRKLRGHRVIGSAGSAEKVASLLDELGLDAAFDYHVRARPGAPARSGAAPGSTCTSTTSAATTSRRRSAPCGVAGGSRSAARFPSTTPPSRRPGRATSSSSSRRTSRSAAFAARATSTCSTRCSASFGRCFVTADCTGARPWSTGSRSAPAALARMMRGETVGKTLVRIA